MGSRREQVWEKYRILKTYIQPDGSLLIGQIGSFGFLAEDKLVSPKENGVTLRVAQAGPEINPGAERLFGSRMIWLNYNNEAFSENEDKKR